MAAFVRQTAIASSELLVLIPVFNDWESLGLLLRKLERVLLEHELVCEVLVVDDASTVPCPLSVWEECFKAIRSVEILALRRNLGHQRAIAIGLTYVDENSACKAVVVMDGDGEDAPEDIPRLLSKLHETGGTQVVFAERTRRSEGLLFRASYAVYKALHVMLTGVRVRVGNFSILPRPLLHRLTAVSELWNHYAAAVFRAKIPYTSIPTQRGVRFVGRSKMNFVSLVVHGLSALSVYSEVIGVRLLIATGLFFAVAGLMLAGIVSLRLTTDLAIPGWTSTLSGLIALLFVQLVTVSLPFVFIILHGRGAAGFLPVRDYVYYVDRVIPIQTGVRPEVQAAPERRPLVEVTS